MELSFYSMASVCWVMSVLMGWLVEGVSLPLRVA